MSAVLNAFVSYTNVSPDEEVAMECAEALRAAGFSVFCFESLEGIGENWQRDYVERLRQSQVMLAVVSNTYLFKPDCQNEVDVAASIWKKNKLLLVPIVIEPLNEAAIEADKGADSAHFSLMRSKGYGMQRRPSREELKALGESLMTAAAKQGLVEGQSTVSPTIELPLTVAPNYSGEVLLVLDVKKPGASQVSDWLVNHGIHRDGRNRWRATNEQYETQIRQSLEKLLETN